MKKALFWLFATALIAVVVFKLWDNPIERIVEIYSLRRLGVDNVNPIPFKTLKMCFNNIQGNWAKLNLIGNTVPFYVFGIVSSYVWEKYNKSEIFIAVSCVIVLCEILQYIFLLGVCDVDDIILDLLFLNLGIYSLK